MLMSLVARKAVRPDIFKLAFRTKAVVQFPARQRPWTISIVSFLKVVLNFGLIKQGIRKCQNN